MTGRDDDAATLDSPGRDVLAVSRVEARETIDHQLATIDDIDSKAIRILRVNALLAGLVLTGASVVVRSGVGASEADVLNSYLVSGVGFLLLSTALAAVTYTSSDVRPGLAATDLRTILEEEYPDEQVWRGLLESYADWIEFNYETNVRNAPLVSATIALLVWALGFVAVGVVAAFRGPLPWYAHASVLTTLLAFTASTGLYGQVRRWGSLHAGRNSGRWTPDAERERLSDGEE